MGHHYVPQRYARNFEDPTHPRETWVHERGWAKPRRLPIKTMLNSRGFYTEEFERLLADEIEAPANRVIAKLIASKVEGPGTKWMGRSRIIGGRIEPVERFDLAVYIAAMMRRVPAHRVESLKLVPKVMDGYFGPHKAAFAELASYADDEQTARRAAELLAIFERLDREYRVKLPDEIVAVMNDPRPTALIVEAVRRMGWRLLIAPGPQCFAASDNPVYFNRIDGLGTVHSGFSMPLSSTHALSGSHRGQAWTITPAIATEREVKEINRRTADNADRMTTYHEPAPWLTALMARASYGLRQHL